MSREIGEIYRDTACFSDRQWFVEGYEQAFSTKTDAEQAVKLGGKMAYERACEMRQKLSELTDSL